MTSNNQPKTTDESGDSILEATKKALGLLLDNQQEGFAALLEKQSEMVALLQTQPATVSYTHPPSPRD